MKILGVSLGTKNGNNDTMCRVALEAAKEKGAEIEFIHLHDWNIDYCSGCAEIHFPLVPYLFEYCLNHIGSSFLNVCYINIPLSAFVKPIQ